MLGGRSNLPTVIKPYLEAIEKADKDKARNLYFFLSPVFFYIHILYEMRRQAWRIAIVWCGIFCERIQRNLFQAIDEKSATNIWQEISTDKSYKSFERRNNKLRSELSNRGYEEAESLANFLKGIYFTRSHRGLMMFHLLNQSKLV